VKDADQFVSTLERNCELAMPEDFWAITLPNDLATSSPVSPSLYAYYASQVLLDAKALFSNHKVSYLLDPTIPGHPKPPLIVTTCSRRLSSQTGDYRATGYQPDWKHHPRRMER